MGTTENKEFPKRVKQHVTETSSYKIFSRNIPDNWLIREVSERDYGIDLYVELVNEKDQLTGDLFSVQLKGISGGIEWKEYEVTYPDGRKKIKTFYKHYGVKISTTNYWNEFPIPVFLVIVDLDAEEVFFEPVKKAIRRAYNKYLDQQSFIYNIDKINRLKRKNTTGLYTAYYEEKYFKTMEENIIQYITNYQHYREYCEYEYNRDCFLPVDEEKIIFLQMFYNNMKTLCDYFGLNWDIEPFDYFLKKDQEEWNDSEYLHERTNDQIVDSLFPLTETVADIVKDYVVNKERLYWTHSNIILFNIVLNLNNPDSHIQYRYSL